MAGGSVRDLMVQLRLDQSQFKNEMVLARSEVRKLEAEFKAVKSDEDVADAGALLKKNLEAQVKAMTEQVDGYEKRLNELKAALNTVKPGSRDESQLTRDIKSLETSLNNAKTYLNTIKRNMETFKADEFVRAMEGIVQTGNDMKMAYSFLLGDWAKETADLADLANVSREQALAFVEKIAKDRPGWYDGWADQTDEFIRQLIKEVPLSYSEVATIMANAMQAGGVAVEDIEEFTRMFAMLQSSTNLTGEEGAMQFGKFLTIMEADVDAYTALASVIVDLGNNVAAQENEIVETAMRSASALRAVGLSAEDVLGISASALTLGMEPAAAASSLEKLAKKAGGSAEFAAKGYEEFRQKLAAAGKEVTSFYDLQVAIDADSSVRKGLIERLGMTGADFDRLMKNAVQTEKVAWLMGQTVDEFAAAWAQDPAKYFVSLFETIGQLDESGAESIFNILGELGITEIREGRLASNFAMVSENLSAVLDLARVANKEASALEREAKTLFETTQSQRQMNENKSQNFLQKIGEGATAVRQTWDNLWANMQQTLTENLPEWAQTGIGATVEILSELGSVIDSIGNFAQGIYYTGQVYRDIKKTNWGRVGEVLKPLGKSVGKMGLGVGAAFGLIGLVDYLTDMAESTQSIQEALNGIQINVDEESKKRALAAFQEVQDAADRLSGKELEDLSTMSRVVQAGYGDEDMFGRALAYEKEMAKRDLQELNLSYGEQLADKNEAIAQAFDKGDTALAEVLAAQRDALKMQWEQDANAIENEYSRTVSALFNGMISTDEEMAQKLNTMASRYSLFALLEGMKNGELPQSNKNLRIAIEALFNEGLMGQMNYDHYMDDPSYFLAGLWRHNWSKKVLQLMEKDFEDVYGNDFMNGLLSAALDADAFQNMDFSQVEGAFSGLVAAMDLRGAILDGGNVEAVGAAITDGLAYGMLAKQDALSAAAVQLRNTIVSALKGALDIHSPSGVTRPLGAFTTEGFVAGMLDKEQDVRGSVRRMMLAAKAEADALSPKINAAMMMMGGGVLSGGAGLGGGVQIAGKGTPVINNYYNVSGSVETQQNVRRLAQQLARAQQYTNQSVGKT